MGAGNGTETHTQARTQSGQGQRDRQPDMAGPRNEQEESSRFSLKVNWLLLEEGRERKKKECPDREEE